VNDFEHGVKLGEPKEIGVLFAAPMVLALLEGRKTNTRRTMKPQPRANDRFGTGNCLNDYMPPDALYLSVGTKAHPHYATQDHWLDFCPYGKPGARLWVREAHQIWSRPMSHDSIVCYRADNSTRVVKSGGCVQIPNGTVTLGSPLSEFEREDGRWRPSIHMPRAACRLVLEVTETRVERVQDILEADAHREGVPLVNGSYVRGFVDIWHSINGAKSWDANPWVWVVGFKEVWRAETEKQEPQSLHEALEDAVKLEAPKEQIVDLFEALKQSLAEAKNK
jgi:hypothetical protein